jgi:hypothetical protein
MQACSAARRACGGKRAGGWSAVRCTCARATHANRRARARAQERAAASRIPQRACVISSASRAASSSLQTALAASSAARDAVAASAVAASSAAARADARCRSSAASPRAYTWAHNESLCMQAYARCGTRNPSQTGVLQGRRPAISPPAARHAPQPSPLRRPQREAAGAVAAQVAVRARVRVRVLRARRWSASRHWPTAEAACAVPPAP